MLQQYRQRGGSTQAQVAGLLGVTQAYYSMLESGKRPLTAALAGKLAAHWQEPRLLLQEENLVLSLDRLADGLASLGYPGYSHRAKTELHNPASLLLAALGTRPLEARLVEGFVWLLMRYADHLDWEWLLPRVKQRDLQNRLGFLVALARSIAEAHPDALAASTERLKEVEQQLEPSRLVREDWFGDLTNAEKRWLREDRPALAVHWNLLTDFKPADIRYVKRN